MKKLIGFVFLIMLLTGCGSSGNNDATGAGAFASEAAFCLGRARVLLILFVILSILTLITVYYRSIDWSSR